jgi:hypothetical protein
LRQFLGFAKLLQGHFSAIAFAARASILFFRLGGRLFITSFLSDGAEGFDSLPMTGVAQIGKGGIVLFCEISMFD